MNRSQKSMLTAAFIFMVIGFAAVATTLTINGTVKFTANNDNFGDGVIFTSASSNKGTASISQDGKTIDFETESLSMLNETAVLNYTISNLSTMYDAEATLECVYTDTNNAYNNYIQFSLDKDEYEIASGGSVNGSLTTQLKQVTTDAHQIGIRCTIVANAVERDSVGTLPISNTTTLSGVLYDENDDPIANAVLAVFSTKQVITTDENGIVEIPDLEDGTHEIYLMSGYTISEVEEMSKENIKTNAIASAKFTTSTIKEIVLSNDNDTIEYKIKLNKDGLEVTALSYEGEYDGEAHGISVSSIEGAIIEYSTDGINYSTINPTYSDVLIENNDIGERVIYYRVTADGYKKVQGSRTITIRKAAGYINLSSLKGEINEKSTTHSFTITSTHGGVIDISELTETGITITRNNSTVNLSNIVNLPANTEIKIRVTSAETNNYLAAYADYTLAIITSKFNPYSQSNTWIYLDANNGSDTNGDGSKSNPYKTLDKLSSVITGDSDYEIILADGSYTINYNLFTMNYSGNLGIIGNKEKTIIKATAVSYNHPPTTKDYTISFYRLKWDGNNAKGGNNFYLNNSLEFYNVLFDNIGDSTYGYFVLYGTFEMYNCTKTTLSNNMLRTNLSKIKTNKLVNCYGPFTSGYSTQQSDWDYQTNRILTTDSVLSSDYRITEDNSLWKDVGTGTDPDGSQADLGVYGGQFSWDYELDIN